MIRRITHENGHCLFFPKRKKGRRFVAGRKVWVWLFEEWKHIELGPFEVILPEDPNKELFTTAEDLECKVNANFKIEVGGEPKEIESRLEKATYLCPPQKKKKYKVGLSYFKIRATEFCKSSTKKIIKESNFINLMEDADYRADVSKRIGEELRKDLEINGLILVESTVIIELMEPKNFPVTKNIIDKWLAFKKIENSAKIEKLEIEKEAEIDILKIKKEREKEAYALDEDYKIYIKNLDVENKEKEGKLEIDQERQEKDKREKIDKIRKEIEDFNKESRLDKIRRDTEIKLEEENKKEEIETLKRQNEAEAMQHKFNIEKEAENKKEEIENLKRQNEAKVMQYKFNIEKEAENKKDEIENLKRQNEANELQHKLNMLDCKNKAKKIEMEILELTSKEIDFSRKKGEVDAENIKKINLAESADVIKMREILFEALPKVMEEANRPIEKIGEIRAINFTGLKENAGQNNISGFLASVSSIPLIKEVMRFLKEFLKDLDNEGKSTQ